MTSKATFVLILIFGALCLAACSDFKVEGVAANHSLVVITLEPSGENCPNGGKRVVSGIDANRDGELTLAETVSISYVCTGEEGQSALVNVEEIPAGETCQFGGQLIETGIDLDGDGQLSEAEVVKSYPICSGTVPQTGGSIAKISTFLNHSCALLSNKTVQCWGLSGDGVDASTAPLSVPGIAKGLDVAAGCALSEDGLVRCWDGMNASPRAVPNLDEVTAIAGSASHHRCALLADGSVQCWGRNDAGQLGIGNYVSTSAPLPVIKVDGMPLTGVKAIEVGVYHTCALMEDATVTCWGWNELGQLGASVGSFSSRAVAVSGLSGVEQLALGYNHSCARLTDESVKCWGSNEVGQLGPAIEAASSVQPVQVFSGDVFDTASIAAGYGHSCAVDKFSGSVVCWGWNVYGQLGNVSAPRVSPTPVMVEGLSGVQAMALGEGHSCALLRTGKAKCWGNNSDGQFGNGVEAVNPGYNLTPAPVIDITGLAAISSGYRFSCALLADGTASCWGSNEFYQLGNDRLSVAQRFPSPVEKEDGEAFGGIEQLALGFIHACALTTDDGGVWCWGDNGMSQLGLVGDAQPAPKKVVLPGGGASMIASGHAHSCAVMTGVGAYCWGYNEFGQTGNLALSENTVAPYLALSTSAPGTAAIDGLALGRAHSCAALTDGTVKCWGDDTYGQLGGVAGNSTTPVQIANVTGVQQLASGHAHICALMANGGVQCWGSNLLGEAGAAIDVAMPSIAPTSVPLSGTAIKIATGYQHTCAVMSGGKVRCWGSNAYGQLGNGLLTDTGTPVEVDGVSDAVDVSTGYGHTCALLSDGTAKCWGDDTYGQLGQVNGNPKPVDAVFLQ